MGMFKPARDAKLRMLRKELTRLHSWMDSHPEDRKASRKAAKIKKEIIDLGYTEVNE